MLLGFNCFFSETRPGYKDRPRGEGLGMHWDPITLL